MQSPHTPGRRALAVVGGTCRWAWFPPGPGRAPWQWRGRGRRGQGGGGPGMWARAALASFLPGCRSRGPRIFSTSTTVVLSVSV